MLILTVALAVLTAASNATSSLLQRQANREEPDRLQLSPRLIADLLRRPAWLGGFAAVIISFLLQAGALATGQLALVQPIIALELPLTLVGASLIWHSRLHRLEWAAVALMTVGLGSLIAFLGPQHGASGASPLAWAIGTGATLATIAGLTAASRRRPGPVRAALLGAATGLGFGLTAAFTKAAMHALGAGVATFLTSWETYAMAISGVGAMFLLQNALQAGGLIAAQPGITLLDPFAAILWGVFAFREETNTGPILIVAAAGGALMVAGAVLLSRSPLLNRAGQPSRSGPASPQPDLT